MRKLLLIAALAVLLGSACASTENAGDEPASEEQEYAQEAEENSPPDEGYQWEEVSPEEGDEAETSSVEKDDSDIAGYIPEGEAMAGEPYTIMEAVTEMPRKDRRYLCGYATNVFVGEVVEQTSTDPLDAEQYEAEPLAPPIPKTQFLVTPDPDVSQVKGTLDSANRVLASDAVTLAYQVNQTGGLNDIPELELLEGDPLLIPGQSYLFATAYDETNNWYSIVVQPEGDLRITSESQRDRAIRDFKKGCKNEVTPEDVAQSLAAGEELTEDEQYSEEDPDYVLREEEEE